MMRASTPSTKQSAAFARLTQGASIDHGRQRSLGVALLLLLAGCHSYQFGARSLYAPDVATVYVPIFASDGFDPDLAERLTEAVIKEIQLKTLYRVVATADADSMLTGRIVGHSRSVLVEDFFDRPRELEQNLRVEVSWLNRRRLPIREGALELPPELVGVNHTATLIPEAGESVVVAQQEAIENLAEQIVAIMETPW